MSCASSWFWTFSSFHLCPLVFPNKKASCLLWAAEMAEPSGHRGWQKWGRMAASWGFFFLCLYVCVNSQSTFQALTRSGNLHYAWLCGTGRTQVSRVQSEGEHLRWHESAAQITHNKLLITTGPCRTWNSAGQRAGLQFLRNKQGKAFVLTKTVVAEWGRQRVPKRWVKSWRGLDNNTQEKRQESDSVTGLLGRRGENCLFQYLPSKAI